MESINLEIKNKIRLTLNGDENKVIEFNPNDLRIRERFLSARDKIFNSQKEFDIKLKELQKEEPNLEKAFKLEQELFDFMKEIVDGIFGEGTTLMVTDGAVDVFGICNFIIAISPYFQAVTEKQKNKYTNSLKNAGVI